MGTYSPCRDASLSLHASGGAWFCLKVICYLLTPWEACSFLSEKKWMGEYMGGGEGMGRDEGGEIVVGI